MSTAAMGATELAETLNGFDEIAISRTFGEDVTALRERPLMFLRALAFIDHRRQGQKDAEAYVAAMEILTKDLDSYFPDDPIELDPEHPETAEGKEDEPLF